MNQYHLNYFETLNYIIDISNLSIDKFAQRANISSSLIRHADSDWNPKLCTVEKICTVINISLYSFFIIAEYKSGIRESITLKYVIDNNKITPEKINKTLKQIRINSNMSSSQLAKKSGINKANISNREHLKINNHILCSTLEKYAYSYGLNMSDFCEILDKD